MNMYNKPLASEHSNLGKVALEELIISIGITEDGTSIEEKISDVSNFLLFGNSGSGKTSFVYALLGQILTNRYLGDIKIAIYDSKAVDYSFLNSLQNLLMPVSSDLNKAGGLIGLLNVEIDERVQLFQNTGVKNLNAYNAANPDAPLPRIIVIMDDINSLVREESLRDSLTSVFSRCSSVGINVISVASSLTPRFFKSSLIPYFPYRMIFSCSKPDSDYLVGKTAGAKLLPWGEIIYKGRGNALKCNAAYLNFDDIKTVVSRILVEQKEQSSHNESAADQITNLYADESENDDSLLADAIACVINAKQASVSMLQRRFRIDYNRAARLIDVMEEQGIVGPADGASPRRVLMTIDQDETSRYGAVKAHCQDSGQDGFPIKQPQNAYELFKNALKNKPHSANSEQDANEKIRDISLEDFPQTLVDNGYISIYHNKVHIHHTNNVLASKEYNVSIPGNSISSIHYKPATMFSKGYLLFAINPDVEIRNVSTENLEINESYVSKGEYSKIQFGKSNNKTMLLLAQQLAEDINQTVLIE